MPSLLIKLAVLMVLMIAPYNLIAQDKDGIFVSDTKELTAKVDSINPDARIVVLKYDEGRLYKIKVGDDMKDFNQIEVGDKLKIEYSETFEVTLVDIDEKLTNKIDSEFHDATSIKEYTTGKDVFEDISEIEALDIESRIVTLKDKYGESMTLKIDDSVKGLERLKVGDKIKAIYTRTITISPQ